MNSEPLLTSKELAALLRRDVAADPVITAVTADSRTNSLLVNAAPRDLAEVRLLVEQLDVDSSESVNQVRIVVLKNALALDVSTTLNAALLAARGGGAGAAAGRNAALELLLTQPDGSRLAASGMLEDVRITADARTNRLFLTGPAESLGARLGGRVGLDDFLFHGRPYAPDGRKLQ